MKLRSRVLCILLVTAFSIALLAIYGIRLGLDLRGGSRSVIEVVTDDAVRSTTNRTITDIREQLRSEGVSFQDVVRTDTNRFEVTGLEAGNSALLDLPNWTRVGYSVQMQPEYEAQIREDAIAQTIRVIRNRLDNFGVAEAEVVRYGAADSYQLVTQVPGIDDPERINTLISSTALLEIKLGDTNGLPQDPAIISGGDLKDAYRSRDSFGRPAVGFALRADAADRFGRFTSENIGRSLAIILDGQVQSIARIDDRITDSGIIQGGQDGFSQQKADDLILVLKSGALPASVRSVSEQFIGPSLGKDSIKQGITAAAGALIAVMSFVLFYYRLAGLNALIAMLLNLIILMGAMSSLNATLTLPGIAGIILTVGVGIDSNVLIFERIREELRAGAAAAAAVGTGFRRVFTTLLDTHLASLIAAMFLFLFGTGPVKGFAVTLVIGLTANVFTSVFVSRTIFDVVLRRRGTQRLFSI